MTATAVTAPNQPSPGISIAAAAALTGRHKNTIRRYIKQGRLPSTLVRGKYGQEYQVSGTISWRCWRRNQEPLAVPKAVRALMLDVEVVSGEDTPGRQGLAGEVTAEVGQGMSGSASPDQGSLSSLVELLQTIQVENRQLAGQVGFLQAENGQLKTQLKQLPAPPAAPPASTAGEPAIAGQQRTAGRPRRWRLFRWVWRAVDQHRAASSE